ncbi:MAG: hypothetical protein ICV68_04290, partial [Pyrinomonadaceae bacterium]|nr:hypothetical protein [Pyrinomonadaceae bacterium]
HGLYIRAYVNDKSPLADYVKSSLDGNLKNTCPELTAETRQQKIAAWLETLRQQGTASDYLYGQIIRFWKGRSHSGLDHMPAYNPQVTDPLVMKTMLARIRA